MLIQLLVFVLSALALSVPDPQVPNGEHCKLILSMPILITYVWHMDDSRF